VAVTLVPPTGHRDVQHRDIGCQLTDGIWDIYRRNKAARLWLMPVRIGKERAALKPDQETVAMN
jgi:hypothetical protein